MLKTIQMLNRSVWKSYYKSNLNYSRKTQTAESAAYTYMSAPIYLQKYIF